MNNPKFTKGPWFANGVFVGTSKKLDDIVSGVGIRSDGESYANSALIAAAPDMYDMLASIENDDNKIPAWLWDKIQATLAKARGES